MALIDRVQAVCERLGPAGWAGLFLQHGLDITLKGSALKAELAKPLTQIDRALPGFEDFALEGTRGVEPARPARSLLYHAIASPNVLRGADGVTELSDFPTLAEIEAVEDYVFGCQPPTLSMIRTLAGPSPLAVAVYAYEYRPAHETVHRRHADLCLSRTGVARVGTSEARYDARARGFLPFVEGDPYGMRVLPARYGVFLAAEWLGSQGSFGPMRPQGRDQGLEFWVPLHKLFSGKECIRGLDLHVTLQSGHMNEKLRRLHLVWAETTRWKEPEISRPPFVITSGIAELSKAPADGVGLLVPQPHPLVEKARIGAKDVTFTVPPGSDTLSSSLYVVPTGSRRRAPEFVHARHRVENGKVTNLNESPDVADLVAAGGYEAQHYIDWTGDGWVEGSCAELAADVPRKVAAYSLVTAPDFFVHCDQRELLEWTEQSVQSDLRRSLWVYEPRTLSDERLAPNLNFRARFVKEDQTVSAIVTLPGAAGAQTGAVGLGDTVRHSWLPDSASAIYDPGWDVSRDVTQGTRHLAAYGLGSPFPEDAKLCAALSTFWPSVAPDSARVFQPNVIGDASPTVAPLTDEEVGIGGTSWDGFTGPTVVQAGGAELVEYQRFDNVDYVDSALAGRFTLAYTGQIETREYERRVHAMARAYRALGAIGGTQEAEIRRKATWGVLSFKRLEQSSPELDAAQAAVGRTLTMPVYRIDAYKHGAVVDHPSDLRKVRVRVRRRALLFVDGLQLLVKRGAQPWYGEADV